MKALVNAAGQPIEFYHGTMHHFTAFDEAAARAVRGGGERCGFFFTRSLDYARTYGDIVFSAHLLSAGVRQLPDIDEHFTLTCVKPADLASYARQGVDCLCFDDPDDPTFPSEYIVFRPEQIRVLSVRPVA